MKKRIKLITSVLGLSLLFVVCTATPKTDKMEKGQESINNNIFDNCGKL